jgi:ASC-1-like (ASCH) protein
MKILELHCQNPWFSFLRKGIKTIEGRKYSTKYQDLRKNDIIIFCNKDDKFKAKVVNITIYKNLDEYLTQNDLNNILPTIKSLEKAREIYLNFNSEEELKKYKFIGIEIKVIS